ncbi:ATP/GTP-binding protein [Streptomyces sp. NPDC047043]|uniref:GTP-binding protein n=1 Tax=Streptomyces sp. NPDC047043 TaxID=3154497 RepID=UPI0033D34136
MSGRCDRIVPLAVKIVVSGGPGVGKSTFIGAISEIEPGHSEGAISQVSVGVDALDFGRITLDPTIALYLFGTPGDEQGSCLWDDLAEGALGAVVLADGRRVEECLPAVEYFEARGVPFVVAVNRFDGVGAVELEEVRGVPVLECDARERASVRDVLGALMDRVVGVRSAPKGRVAMVP